MKTTYVANAVIIRDDGKILLTQRFDPSNPSIHLKWQVPGGGIDKGETAQRACIRKAFEETGLRVKIISKPLVVIQSYPQATFHMKVFLTKPISDTIDTRLDEETNDASWYTFEEIKNLKTLDGTLEMISRLLKLWKKS